MTLGQALARSQLPQALAALLAVLFPPGFKCCGHPSTSSGTSSSSNSSGSANLGISNADLKQRLDLVVQVTSLASVMWRGQAQRVPELVACLTESRLLERAAAALLRALAADCSRLQPRSGAEGAAGPSTSSGVGGAGGGSSSCSSGGRGSGGKSHTELWIQRPGAMAETLWLSLSTACEDVVTSVVPSLPPRTWLRPDDVHTIAASLRQCREALSGPALQLWLGGQLLAVTHRCLEEAEAAETEAGASGWEAGAAAAAAVAADAAASARATGEPGQALPVGPQHRHHHHHQQQQQQQQRRRQRMRWHALPNRLQREFVPLPAERLTVADHLMDVVERIALVWDFTVSGPLLPRLGQMPLARMFDSYPEGEAMRKVACGQGTPEDAAAAAAAEAQLPPLHPPSYTALQVFDMTHAALAAAVEHAPAEAVCVIAPALLARLAMELPPRQAAARLPELWRTLARALPRLACGGTGGDAGAIEAGMLKQGPYWSRFAATRTYVTRPLALYLALLLQLQFPAGPAAAAPASRPTSVGTAAAEQAAAAAGPGAAAAAGPGPAVARPDFSLRCALAGGLLPALEALLRRLGRIAARPVARIHEAAQLLDAAQQVQMTVHRLLRTSGVWPAILAHGPPRQVAALVRTMGKVLVVLGAGFAALWQQNTKVLGHALRLFNDPLDVSHGLSKYCAALVALMEQGYAMLDEQLARSGLARAGAPAAATSPASVVGQRLFTDLALDGTMDLIASSRLERDWMAAVVAGGGGSGGGGGGGGGDQPVLEPSALDQMQRMAAWAIRQWLPELLRQVHTEQFPGPSTTYVLEMLKNLAARGLWQARRARVLERSGIPVPTPAAAAPDAGLPAGAAAAAAAAADSAAGWRRYLLQELDLPGQTELRWRDIVATAAWDEDTDRPAPTEGLYIVGMMQLEEEEQQVQKEAAWERAGSTGLADGVSSAPAAAAAVQEPQRGTSGSASSRELPAFNRGGDHSSRQHRRQQQRSLLGLMREVTMLSNDDMVQHMLTGLQASSTRLEELWARRDGLGVPPQEAGTSAAGSGTAPATSYGGSPWLAGLEPILALVDARTRDPTGLLYGDAATPPTEEAMAAVAAEAGLVLCGNPACCGLEGESEAELMAAGAAGQQDGSSKSGSKGRIKTCSRCGAVRYCCGACQLQHWTAGGHSKACAGAAAAGGSRAGA
ncbi:hypothetical protein HYH02_008810 [Chlamydomonas schloesseri]|uniref:phytol kinase n=1 Tax=Chlamydomonas schloesseri TaxID=2026947 RepID=A0A835WDB3_9CHLO|nr:hypothetical protein HYH02_008810 [Chlamydomonas schloesseri]|eukprot:KAG2445345.1 hypothetical protein HYH02_008810 [Chlamydomonas schloesseri]